MESKPFVLRCLHGSNKGKYFVSGGYAGASFTDEQDKAPRFTVADAYGNVACSIDMLRIALSPELADEATDGDSDCDTFAKLAASDMFQPGGPEIQSLIAKSVRRSPSEPMLDPEGVPPAGNYMSAWEWLARLACQKGPPHA